jgi:hypothetical protein
MSGLLFAGDLSMLVHRSLSTAVMTVVVCSALARAQTPPPQPQQQTQPQQPTTTVVGADGRMVSLIFLRADAENVTRRVYAALLAREPNPQEFAESAAELQRGRLPQQLEALTQQPEFKSRAGSTSPAQMLDQVFQGMLDRPPTAAEAKTYLPQIQGKQYAQAMVKLVTSDSFRKQAARDRATAGTPVSAAAEPSPTPRVTVPPPPPVPTPAAPAPTAPPPAVTSQRPGASPTTSPPEPQLPAARPPLRPAPFPTARGAETPMPLAAPPRLTSEWKRVLMCQEQIVAALRSDRPDLVLLRFDAAEISPSIVRGTAVDSLDANRRLSYQCADGKPTFTYLDSRPARMTRNDEFPVEEVKACHAAVIAALKRNRRGIAVSFHTAGMMPTDSLLLIRGAGMDQEKTGQMQPFTYQCQWDGNSVTDATFTLSVR